MSRLVTAGVKSGSLQTARGETCSQGNRSGGARLQHRSVFSVPRVDGIIFIQLGTTSSEVSIPVPSQSWMKTKTLKTAVFYFTPRHNNLRVFLINSARASGLWTTKNSNREWVVDLETQVKEEFVGAKGV